MNLLRLLALFISLSATSLAIDAQGAYDLASGSRWSFKWNEAGTAVTVTYSWNVLGAYADANPANTVEFSDYDHSADAKLVLNTGSGSTQLGVVPTAGRPGWAGSFSFTDTNPTVGKTYSASLQGTFYMYDDVGWPTMSSFQGSNVATSPTVQSPPEKTTYKLTLAFLGYGSGTVCANGVNYSSGATTTIVYAAGTVVTLDALATSTSVWKGFNGDLSSKPATSLSVTMNADLTVSANFGSDQKLVSFAFLNPTQVYDGCAKGVTVQPSDPSATYDVTFSGGFGPFALSGRSSPSGPVNAGTYSVNATGTGGWEGSGTSSLTINPKPVTYTFSNLIHTHDGSAKTATVMASDPNATCTTDLTKGPAEGSYTVSATASGNYTGSGTATLEIRPADRVSASISATPTSGSEPGATTVTWSTTNATSASVTGSGLSSVAANGSETITGLTQGTHTYTITAQGNGGPVTESATFAVTAAQSVDASISASPASTSAPGSATISWSSSNATSIAVSGQGVSSTVPSGSQAVGGLSAGTYTYSITAQGPGGPVSRSTSVTVSSAAGGGSAGGNVTADIALNLASATPSDSPVVSWTTTNATSVNVTGDGLASTAVNGSQAVGGLAIGTHFYTITAQGPGGPVSRSTSINILSGPVEGALKVTLTQPYAPASGVLTAYVKNPDGVQFTGDGLWAMMTSNPEPYVLYYTCPLSDLSVGVHTFSMVVNGPGGPITRTASVNVAAAPIPVQAFIGSTAAWGGLSDTFDIQWSSSNASSASITGPLISSNLNYDRRTIAASQLYSIGGYGPYLWKIEAQGYKGPITAWTEFVLKGTGRSITMSANPNPVGGAGGTVTFSGTSSSAGPGWITIWKSSTWETQSWGEVDTDPDTGDPIYGWIYSTQAEPTIPDTPLTTIPATLPTGSGTIATWQQPASNTGPNSGAGASGRTYYYAIVGSTDSQGGYARCDWSQDPGPEASAQTVTLSSSAKIAPPGAVITLSASGGQTGYVWDGAHSTSGDTNSFTVPSGATLGESFLITVYSPAGIVGATSWRQSNCASVAITVGKGTPTITWPDPPAIPYGTALSAAQLNATANTPGTFAYTPAVGAVVHAGATPLKALFTPADATSWNAANAAASIVVTKASLTASADDRTRTFGSANLLLTISYSGFVSGDTPTSLSVQPAATTLATVTSPVGIYPISVSSGVSSDYNFTYRAGTLTITPKPVNFSGGDDVTVTYDGTAKPVVAMPDDPAATYIITYVGTGGTHYGPSAGAPTGAGTYGYTIGATGNYSGTVAGTLTINKAAPLVSWPLPSSITYGTTLGGAQLNASCSVAGGFEYAPSAGTVLPAGNANLSVHFTPADVANYQSTTAYVPLTVTRAVLTATANDQTRMYGAPNPTLSLRYSGFVNGESSSTVTEPQASTPATVTTGVGTYPISLAGGAAPNYTLTLIPGTLTITPATQTISLTPVTANVSVGDTVTLTASGGYNGYIWTGAGASAGTADSVNVTFPTSGTYTISVANAEGGNYQRSNVASSTIVVASKRVITGFSPIVSSYTVNDPASPMDGQNYPRIWQVDGGWSAYLGRMGVKFRVTGEGWPSVQTLEIQCLQPGADWTVLASRTPGIAAPQADEIFEVMLGETVPGQPLVPLSYPQGVPLTGEWRFRARLRDAGGVWSDFSPEVPVNVVLPLVTKALSGQTVPPAGAAGDWFTPSPVKTFSVPLWIP